jgi:vancomycin resistance protein VanJ
VLTRASHRRARPVRSAAVGIGTAYALALLIYAAVLRRGIDLTGLFELANNFAPWWYAPVPAILLVGLGLRSRPLILAGLAAATAFGVAWGHLFLPLRTPPAEAGSGLTVMTLNVLAQNQEHAALAAAIAAEDPDVVALQELESDAATDLSRALGERYPNRAFQTAPKVGAGILSRYPLGDVAAFQLSEGGNWGQRTVVETPGGALTLFNVHPTIPRLVWSARRLGPLRLPIGYDSALRSAEIRRLIDLLDAVDGPLLVLGDFNMTEYSADYRLVRGSLGDAYRAVGWGFGHTFPRLGSFPRSLPAPWPVLRLDYVWHSSELRPLSAHVGPSGRSDHHPVIVRLADHAGAPRLSRR